MNTTAIIGAIAPALIDLIDKSVEDKDAASKAKAAISSELLKANSTINRAAADVVMSEAKGESWLQRNWRPMLMVWFAVLIGAYWFGFVPVNMPVPIVEKLFTLVQIGVGGYVVGRSGEKIAGAIAPHLGGSPRP